MSNSDKSNSFLFQSAIKFVRIEFELLVGSSIEAIRLKTNAVFGAPNIAVIPKVQIIPTYFRQLSHTLLKNYCLKVYKEYPLSDQDPSKLEPLKLKLFNYGSNNKLIYYIHGGGWFIMGSENYANMLKELSQSSNANVVAVEYRKIPENIIFSSFEDSLAGYLYLTGSTSYGGRGLKPSDIVLSGDSAGGGLVSMVIHFIRNTNQPQPAGVVLWSPNFDLITSQPSELIMGDRDILPDALKQPLIDNNLEILTRFWTLPYYGADEIDRRRMANDGSLFGPKHTTLWPLLSPMRDPDLSKLPPMLVMCGEYDSFRDYGIVYARRLFKPNTHEKDKLPPMTVQIYQNQPHEFPIIPFSPFKDISLERASNFIKLAHNPGQQIKPPYTIQDFITKSKFGSVPELNKNKFEAYFQAENMLPKPFDPPYKENSYSIWDWQGVNYFLNHTALL